MAAESKKKKYASGAEHNRQPGFRQFLNLLIFTRACLVQFHFAILSLDHTHWPPERYRHLQRVLGYELNFPLDTK